MRIVSMVVSLLACAASWTAAAQDYPQQSVRVVVPFSAGGGTDGVARRIMEPLGKVLGQNLVVENRGGANTIIGAQAVAHAPPDGYTLLTTLDMTVTILPAVYHKLAFDPLNDLQPVALLAQIPALFVAHPKVPAQDLKELVAYAKEHPGQLNYGSAVLYGQVLGQQLQSVSGLTYTYVPFKGGGESMQSLLGGHIDFLMLDIGTGLSFLQDGRLKALAITSAKRHPLLPDVPTVGELGWPELEMQVWYGLFAPKGTPSAIVDTLNAGVARVVAEPALRDSLAELGYEAAPISPTQMQDLIRRDAAKWEQAARDGNIQLD